MSGNHGHGRGGSPVEPSARVGRVVVAAVLGCVALTLIGLIVIWPRDGAEVVTSPALEVELVDATVTATEVAPCAGVPGVQPDGCVDVSIEVTSGPTSGDEATFQLVEGPSTVALSSGDRIIVSYNPDGPPETRYLFADFDRARPLFWLVVLFVAAVVALGLFQGLRALIGAGVSLAVLVWVVLPALLEGTSPMLVATVSASAIALLALFLTHGLNHRTAVAYLGTVGSLALTAGLAATFVEFTRLSGLADEEALFLQISAEQVDLSGLLLAGIVIGTLGVLDDVTVTQSSAVWELAGADQAASRRSLYGSALTIGRDHIASTVNTLVLAYAGASLPLLLLFTQSNQTFGEILNGEVIAVEVVRALVGSIGLVASVPLTTGLAVLVVRDAGEPADDETDRPDGPAEAVLPTEPASPPAAEPREEPEPEPSWADFAPDEEDF